MLFIKEKKTGISYVTEELFHMTVIGKETVSNRRRIAGRYSLSQANIKDAIREYGDELNRANDKDLLEIEKKYNKSVSQPIYLYQISSFFDIVEGEGSYPNIRLKTKIKVYSYKRYEFAKKVEKYNALIKKNETKKPFLFGWFSKDYYVEKEKYINAYIDEYFAYLDKQFSILKLKKSLLNDLNKATFISLKFDILKPIILLDNLIEKIATFFHESNKVDNVLLEDIINLSISDFESYIGEQIKKMNSFQDDYDVSSSKELDKTSIEKINEIKSLVFEANE